MLVVETLSATPAPGRRRRRPREEEGSALPSLPLSRTTSIRAWEPFESAEAADAWLAAALASEDSIDELLADGVALLNRALHAQAAAALDPEFHELSPRAAVVARIGYGSGEEVASGRFSKADRVDVHTSGLSRRRAREEQLRPQERVAAVLGGRDRIDACETLLLRARADLDAGREREAALQLRVGLEAILVELEGALSEPDHGKDMAELAGRRKAIGEAAEAAIAGALEPQQAEAVAETVAIAERVLRRRRVLLGG